MISWMMQESHFGIASTERNSVLEEFKEVNRLVNLIRSGVASNKERKALRHANIRYASRILTGRETQDQLVNMMFYKR